MCVDVYVDMCIEMCACEGVVHPEPRCVVDENRRDSQEVTRLNGRCQQRKKLLTAVEDQLD